MNIVLPKEVQENVYSELSELSKTELNTVVNAFLDELKSGKCDAFQQYRAQKAAEILLRRN